MLAELLFSGYLGQMTLFFIPSAPMCIALVVKAQGPEGPSRQFLSQYLRASSDARLQSH